MLRNFFWGPLKAIKRSSDEIKILSTSPLLAVVWYRQTYLHRRSTSAGVARHYRERGVRERV